MRADCLPHVSVAIHVNGNALHEHHADSEDAKAAVRYVEVVSGAEFSLVLTIEPGYAYRDKDLQYTVFLDGNFARSNITTSAKMAEGYTSSVSGTRRHVDDFNCYRKFTFAQHETSINHIPMYLVNPAFQLTCYSRQPARTVTHPAAIQAR